jgi:hydroxypyruvate isomerase
MRYAINIEPLYPKLDFCEKIRRVKSAGFDRIEFWDWSNKDIKKVKAVCEENDVKVTAFCATAQYSMCDREHRDEAVDWVKKTMETAKFLNCDTLIVFPNHFTDCGAANFLDRYSHTEMVGCIVRNLTVLAPILEKEGITLLLEPLHNHGDDAGMSVTDTKEGADIIRTVGSPNVKLLCDFFHMQLMHGNLLPNILNNLDIVPYVHLADAPDRFEPGTGEINYEFLLSEMKKSEFDGIVCYEFFPENDTDEALKTAKALSGRIG